jgi:hypothetical protein
MVTLSAFAVLAQLDAPTSSTQQNWNVWAWIILFCVAALNVAVQIKTLRRTPSLEVDLVRTAGQVAALTKAAEDATKKLDKLPDLHGDIRGLKDSVAGIHMRLAQGDEIIAGLRERQAVNAEAIQTIKATQGEMSVAVHNMASRICRTGNKRGRDD